VLLDQEISDELPYNDYLGYYGPEHRLHLQPSIIENLNTPEQLGQIYRSVIENIRHLPCSPSLYIFRDNPDVLLSESDDSDEEIFDERLMSKYLTARLKLNTLTGEETEELS
jgi:histone deacetylase 1/2